MATSARCQDGVVPPSPVPPAGDVEPSVGGTLGDRAGDVHTMVEAFDRFWLLGGLFGLV